MHLKMAIWIAAFLAMILGGPAVAQQTTYSVQTGPFTVVGNAGGGCVVGECGSYALGQTIQGTITFSAPLAPNLVNSDQGPNVVSLSINDGIRTYTNGAGFSIAFMRFSTNGAGAPTSYTIELQRLPGPPYATATPANPNSRVSEFQISAGNAVFRNNAVCMSRGAGGLSAAADPNSCNAFMDDGSTSQAGMTGPTTLTVLPPVPTLSEWAMILTGLMLAGLAVWRVGAAQTAPRRIARD